MKRFIVASTAAAVLCTVSGLRSISFRSKLRESVKEESLLTTTRCASSSSVSVSDLRKEYSSKGIDATDMPEEEREAIEEQMINLREDCANGDNDACEELRALIEELEAYREDERDEREDDEIESDECAEASRVAYEDCLNVGGSEEDCREEAAVAYEDCMTE